jgi:hypothetical protein
MEVVMKLARLGDKNQVEEVIDLPDEIDPASAFHPSIRLVRASKGADIGAVWDGQDFKSSPDAAAPVVQEQGKNVRLPKDVLKLRARAHRNFLLNLMTAKTGGAEIKLDVFAVVAVMHKLDLIDKGILQPPVHFKLPDGRFALMSRNDLFDLYRAMGQRIEALFTAESELESQIDKGRVNNQEQLEAVFAKIVP